MIIIIITIKITIIIITSFNKVKHITFRYWVILWTHKEVTTGIRKAHFNWERSLIKMPPNLLVTFYFAMLVALPKKVYKTNLVTSDLFPVVMTSFNTATSLLLEPLINMHLTIYHTLFKTNCHINFNIKRFCRNRGCGTTAGWKTFLNVNLLLGGKPQASCNPHWMTSWPVSANISKTIFLVDSVRISEMLIHYQ